MLENNGISFFSRPCLTSYCQLSEFRNCCNVDNDAYVVLCFPPQLTDCCRHTNYPHSFTQLAGWPAFPSPPT